MESTNCYTTKLTPDPVLDTTAGDIYMRTLLSNTLLHIGMGSWGNEWSVSDPLTLINIHVVMTHVMYECT